MNGQGEMIPDRGKRPEKGAGVHGPALPSRHDHHATRIRYRHAIHDRNEPADNLSQHVGRHPQQATALMPIRHVQYAAEPFRIRTNLDETADLTSLMQQA